MKPTLRQLREESAHDSAVYAHEDNLTRLIGFDDPSKHTDQKAHHNYQSHSEVTVGIEVGEKG
jgi:hypothetical protein